MIPQCLRPLPLKLGCTFGIIQEVFKNTKALDSTFRDSGFLGMGGLGKDTLDNLIEHKIPRATALYHFGSQTVMCYGPPGGLVKLQA